MSKDAKIYLTGIVTVLAGATFVECGLLVIGTTLLGLGCMIILCGPMALDQSE